MSNCFPNSIMGHLLLYCVVIFLLEAESVHAKITQIPRQLIIEKGQEVKMRCEQDSQVTQMFWYQQKPESKEKGLVLVVYSVGKDNTENGDDPQGFKSQRPETNIFILSKSSAEPRNSGMYFCSSD
uniref:Ig-like domain-containing protein n=1 Tax=Sarcophilus harrisii TaxID=9305 RepID=A0A7N4NUL7_SARHA